ncbi:MAG: GTP-sensing pleiotropic transcriptional regulator CodY, partial [Defluviitaleaceae bacterium]|nr:GTP-sensing pleiotropic transcriptional regulator CodY [Defluviitaleaceae bacterium]
KKTLTSDEEVAVRIVDCVCAILLRHRDEKFASERRRRAKAVRAIINSLSFSELEAMSHVLTSLGSPGGGEGVFEGVLVAGQIADGLGLARSVVTSALRKLEGANLIETRSLGMKGTYIRVKDALLVEELAKL